MAYTGQDVAPGEQARAEHFNWVAGALRLNRVRLPAPSVSDYITPSGAAASSFGYALVAQEVEVHAFVLNKLNAYDGDPATHVSLSGAVSAGTVVMRWDFGSVATRTVHWRHGGGELAALEHSTDGVTWTLLSSTGGTIVSGVSTISFRQFRWRQINSGSNWLHDFLVENFPGGPLYTIRDALGLFWRPSPANEAGAWCRWDTGALRILGGCRIFWGADAAFRPTGYRIQVSEDAVTWTNVVTMTTAPPASAWREYSWNARYARHIRLIVDAHGSSGTEIAEMDFYSRIVDRVAAEHGHGSGVEPYLSVVYSDGHPQMQRGETFEAEIVRLSQATNLAGMRNYIEAVREQMKFLRND